ncbi:MAG TPA: prephenate dehydratase domain-containing protein [Segeticoccus sp.]|uniref:prephenate dehydratase n=1 Tax=Segeticoccus sp. TaxID=2706531 RepID=UPI002D7F8625|nr:prephenate dehydratase domain-containing protein [Segeticoccus sp.]HET8601972.1 prephenate dehydratase domain-containing protein [Segeticoccus sp.]
MTDVTRSPTRYGFLGPSGTFTETALRDRLAAVAASDPAAVGREELVPFPSVDIALEAVRRGDVAAAMVPIENSVEGGVTATLDALSSGEQLAIIAEQLVPITFVLAAAPVDGSGDGSGMPIAGIRAVGTHPHAWAQVRGWMTEHLPAAEHVRASSTAAAAAAVAAGARPPGAAGATAGDGSAAGELPAYEACVCSPGAARDHGLRILAEQIEDNAGAVTRFVLVARRGRLPQPTGADKTTVVLHQREDRPGGLLDLLEQFATRGINLTRIESRPTGEGLGSYCFSLDCEGHVADERLGEALTGLHRVCRRVVFLGSYPRADARPTPVRAGTSDDDFIAARYWLRSLRGE